MSVQKGEVYIRYRGEHHVRKSRVERQEGIWTVVWSWWEDAEGRPTTPEKLEKLRAYVVSRMVRDS